MSTTAENLLRMADAKGLFIQDVFRDSFGAMDLLFAGLAGCSSSSGTKTITVYSGRSAELIQPLLERF